MTWVNDPWIVGIGGGILSGIAVAILSRALLSRRDKKEYLQKTMAANREVIYALRPGIPEGQVPGKAVVEALIKATSRKYGVDPSDMHDPNQVGEELTKEVMDSSFISAKTKQQYCEQLEGLRPGPTPTSEPAPKGPKPEIRFSRESDFVRYRERMVSLVSLTMGLMVTVTTVLLFLSSASGRRFDGLGDGPLDLLIPAISAMVATVAAATVMMFFRRRERLHRLVAIRYRPSQRDKEREKDDST